MADAQRWVHIVDDVPELAGTRPSMILVLHGFLDAGNAAGLAGDHLEQLGGGKVVATFDVDEFYDYRARRPPMSFIRDHYGEYDAPRLTVRLMRDEHDAPYLLLRGPEPDNRWEAFARGVREVVERFGVERTVALAAVPMTVPHTRPMTVTAHATDTSVLTGPTFWEGELRIPSSAQTLLEVRLGEWGHLAMGYVAHVPHYISQLDYPRAAMTLIAQTEEPTGLALDAGGLEAAAEHNEAEIASYLATHEEISQVVNGLEEQYDAFHRAEQSGSSLLADNRPLPTGEEIGAQFEQFLADLDRPDKPEEI